MVDKVREEEFCDGCLEKLLERARRPDEPQVDGHGRPIPTLDEVWETLDLKGPSTGRADTCRGPKEA